MTNNKQTKTAGKTAKINKGISFFFTEKEVTIKLSLNQMYEIASGLFKNQEDYGFDAPNQISWELRKEFKKLIDERKAERGVKNVD